MGGRGDEAHVADEDVPELRELVDAGAAEEAADRVTRGSSFILKTGRSFRCTLRVPRATFRHW